MVMYVVVIAVEGEYFGAGATDSYADIVLTCPSDDDLCARTEPCPWFWVKE